MLCYQIMFVALSKGNQKLLLTQAIQKAGSERKLASVLSIPKSTIYEYKLENMHLPEERFTKIIKLLGLSAKDYKVSYLDDNWGRVKGGINCVKKKSKSALNKELELARTKIKRGLSEWHKDLRKSNPERYYTIQYERFKKIGEYKFGTKKGHLVRNILEKKIADLLYDNKIDYKYEDLTKGAKGYYFPDFKIGSIIIECTAWRGNTKAYSLKNKIKDLKSVGYKSYVFVPLDLHPFYKAIKPYLVSNKEELLSIIMPG